MPAGFLLFLGYLFLELFVLIKTSAFMGGWAVCGWVALAFFAGSSILQRNKNLALSGRGGSASRLVLSSLAGVLLIVPGFVSDALALFLLLPGFQSLLLARGGAYFMRRNSFTRVFRFGNFQFDKFHDAQESPRQTPEFHGENGKKRRRIDESAIIDVNPEDKL